MLGSTELCPGADVAVSVMLPMPTEWWLRPVSSACRVGAHRAVVWNRLNRSPPAASRSAVGVWHGPPNALEAPKPDVVEQDHQDVGRPGRRTQRLDGGNAVSGSFASYVVRPGVRRCGIGSIVRACRSWLMLRTSSVEEPQGAGPSYGIVAAAHRELAQDVAHMGAHGVDRDEHRGRDLVGGEQLGEMPEHLALLRGQRLDEGAVEGGPVEAAGAARRVDPGVGHQAQPTAAMREQDSRLDAVSDVEHQGHRQLDAAASAAGADGGDVLADHDGHARHPVSGPEVDITRRGYSAVGVIWGTWRTSTSSSPSAWSRSSTPYNAAWSGRTPLSTVRRHHLGLEVLEVGHQVGRKGPADVDLEGLREHARHLLRSEAPTVSPPTPGARHPWRMNRLRARSRSATVRSWRCSGGYGMDGPGITTPSVQRAAYADVLPTKLVPPRIPRRTSPGLASTSSCRTGLSAR